MVPNSPYEHCPVDIKTFVLSPDYLDLGRECWPEVVALLERLFNQDPNLLRLSSYEEVCLDLGIGSGKSFFVSSFLAYGAYRLLCYKNPQGMYGLARGSNITLLNMSKSAQQAKKVVFGEVKARIENSPWFQQYYPPDPNIHSELIFQKGIIIFPGNSRETFPLGYNVFMYNMDEAAFYTETEDHDVAESMFNALDSRVKSRFGNLGIGAITSSPRYVDDFVEKKMKDARKNPSVIFGMRRATWEMRKDDIEMVQSGDCFVLKHPMEKIDGVPVDVKIPNKYRKNFERDARKAWRDFGAVPSLALEAYFTDAELEMLRKLCVEAQLPLCVDGNTVGARIVPDKRVAYFAHADLGLTRDACGLAIGHFIEGEKKVVIDILLRIVSRKRAGELADKGEHYDIVIGEQQVIFEDVREIIYNLSDKGWPIVKVSTDGFQSVDFRQILESKGYATELLSVDKDTSAYDTLKSLINTKRFSAVLHEHFLNECSRLELRAGKKIDHPLNASKDLSDAVAGVCRSIMEVFDEEVEHEETESDDTVRVEIGQQV